MKPDVSIVAERPVVVPEKRRPLNRAEMAHLCITQNGRCGCGCGEKLDALREGIIDEHRVPLALGGSNDLSNREAWRKPCAKAKTSEKDAPAIARAKRLAGETCTGPKREIAKHVNAWAPKGSRKLPKGQKFPSRKTARNASAKGGLRDDPSSSSPTPTHKEETRDG